MCKHPLEEQRKTAFFCLFSLIELLFSEVKLSTSHDGSIVNEETERTERTCKKTITHLSRPAILETHQLFSISTDAILLRSSRRLNCFDVKTRVRALTRPVIFGLGSEWF